MAKAKLPECRVLWTKDVVRWAMPPGAAQRSLLAPGQEPDPEQRLYLIEARYSPALDTLRLYVMGAENWRSAPIAIDEGDHEATTMSLVEYGDIVGSLRYHETEEAARAAWRREHTPRAAD